MKIINQDIEGVKLIKHDPFKDHRGSFTRIYCNEIFNNFDIESKVSQANISINKIPFTLRGFHCQITPFAEDKTFKCINGSIYDIVVDLRKKSKTYLKWIHFNISESSDFSLHVPKGCANAFLTLKPNTVIHYLSSQKYNPLAERGVRYNDPLLKFKWPREPENISDKDKKIEDFNIKNKFF